MGLLDDAIREHLDLKRRHGADPGEVARQESEALGPALREAASAGEAAAPGDAPFDADAAGVAAPGRDPDDAVAVREAEPEHPADASGPEDAASPPATPESVAAPEAGVDDQATEHFDVLADEGGEAAATPAAGDDLFAPGEEPFADEPAPPPAADGDEADEDVLEETPDFLQETPEHDRLWFEQKPPKDFDFDH